MDGVSAIVKKLREKLPDTKIVLVAIFPRSENFSAQRGKILQVNQVLRKLADNKDVFWADFGHRFVTSDGLIPADLMPDYLHLTRRGYEIWADAIERGSPQIIGDQPVMGRQSARPSSMANGLRSFGAGMARRLSPS